MTQAIDSIELTDQEQAAIAAHVDRLREAGETELTAAALLARMAHKAVRGWADQLVEEMTSQQLRQIEEKLRAVPPADRAGVVEELVSTLDAAAPALEEQADALS
jgi:hypothetical protein